MKRKAIYKEAQGIERVRVKAAGGPDAYGGANQDGANAATPCASGARPAADRSPPPATSIGRGRAPPAADQAPFTLVDLNSLLEACFDSLANVGANERSAVDELAKPNAALAATNANLVAKVRKLGNEKTVLQQEINGLRRQHGGT